MSRISAPAFPFTHDTLTGPVTAPIDQIADGTRGSTTATITGIRFFGTGGSTRARIVLTADNGTMVTGVLTNFRYSRSNALMHPSDTPVTIRGTVNREPGQPTVIEVASILPAAATLPTTALAA